MEVLKDKLKNRTKRMLGAPVRTIELTDEHYDDAFEIACESWDIYSSFSPFSAGKKRAIKNNWIKKYMFASCKEILGRIRGKFSGNVNVPDLELKLDYNSLLKEADAEKHNLKTLLV